MEALGSKVIVKVDKKDFVSSTGIKTGGVEKPDRGEVISIGCEISDLPLKVGVTVIFSEYAGKAINEGGVDYILLNYNEIYSVL